MDNDRGALGSRIRDEAGVLDDAIYEEDSTFRPTLGAMWHHCVSTRLVLNHVLVHAPASSSSSSSSMLSLPQQQLRRKRVTICKSPIAERSSVQFTIGEQGLE